MNDVLRALASAFASVLHPRMLVLTIWPMLVALLMWLGLAWLHWETWSHWLGELFAASFVRDWLPQRGVVDLARYASLLLLFALLAPMVLITAVLIAAVVAMPLIVNFVAARDYPALERRHGGSVPGSVANALIGVLAFAGLWIVTLPLWLTGVLAPVLPVVLSAYLNQRLFRFDALSDHAGADEYRAILDASWGRMYVLGLLLALLYAVPVLNLLVPVLSGLAFTHFGLVELAKLRASGARSD
jgi:CysZ protein